MSNDNLDNLINNLLEKAKEEKPKHDEFFIRFLEKAKKFSQDMMEFLKNIIAEEKPHFCKSIAFGYISEKDLEQILPFAFEILDKNCVNQNAQDVIAHVSLMFPHLLRPF